MVQRLELDGGGALEFREEGAQVFCSVCRGMDGAGLYKVWLYGERADFLLGTLVPEGSALRLRRTLSADTLKRAGCWPIRGGKTAMAFSFAPQEQPSYPGSWRWDHRPSRRFSDPVMAESVAALGSMLVREMEYGFQLAAPFDPRRPFPVTMLFCLAQILPVDGQPHAMFSFRADGTPCAARNTE